MAMHATATFEIKKWDEHPYIESDDGAKMTRAEIEYIYHGDIEGESIVQYLMAYRPDGAGTAIALERITGSVGGRAGSFVLQHTSTFAESGVTGTYEVVPGSGAGELRGITGTGTLSVSGEGPYPFALDYDFA